jgi:membrane protein implicated in regulation of membrane protease activity
LLAYWLGKRVLEFMENIWPLIIGVVVLAIVAAAAHYFWRRWRARRPDGDAPQGSSDH